MTSHLKKLWVASARVEDLEVELDQAAEDRNTAIVEAIAAGFPVDQVSAAANLSRAEIATIALASSEDNDRDGEEPALSSADQGSPSL